MIEPEWQALIDYCKQRPFCTITSLEIREGKPVLGIYPEVLAKGTIAFVKFKLTN